MPDGNTKQSGRMGQEGCAVRHAADALLALSARMAAEGRSLVERVVPREAGAFRQWTHYPEGDAIDPDSGARWFYHAHPPEERAEGEHGHFHLFLPRRLFDADSARAGPDKADAVEVVHVVALGFDTDGLPTHWFSTAQWVTNEFQHDAEAIIARLDALALAGAGSGQGLEPVGEWLDLAARACRRDIEAVLRERDAVLAGLSAGDRRREILSQRRFAL